ncbi:chromate efflux transporter [Pseudohoeflea suaedae]|uniref:Chromate efflux transporter n=1 Tax=Pseudohoeflea suaedae TaxID=877384 RepID=A0A4R5PHH6_9HYPH|nr:chromate efflux transporter [Pseudohoeflea suaedae]TDH34367.1 chromate efflux transporter [Pseudohoeflea suaedae]
MSGQDISTKELFSVFGRIGLLSFGGPAGQIALMHRELVEERRWLDEDRFLHALNFCMLLPGPEAMQLATYAGWLKRGVTGGVIAGLLFVLPGFAVILALSAAFLLYGDLPAAEGVLLGLKAAVLAIVVQALVRVAGRALKTPLAWVLAPTAFIGIALLHLPFPAIVLGAGIVGLAASLLRREKSPDKPVMVEKKRDRSVRAAVIWGGIWLLPLVAMLVIFPGPFADMALFFSKAAVLTFGGAYAVLAYAGQQAVEVHGWLMPGEMLAGLGLAETTPGPLILVLVFVGFLGGARTLDHLPIAGGLAGGLVALFFTFAPCFLWIFAGAPHVERLRGVRWLADALAAITAAVVGVIANLAVWFALHVLFAEIGEMRAGPFHLPVVAASSLNWPALAIATGAGVVLIGFRIGLLKVLAAAIAAGLVFTLSA